MDVPLQPDTARGPLPAYQALRASGQLAPDAAQEHAAQRLQQLWQQLRGYDPAPRPTHAGVLASGLLGRLLHRNGNGDSNGRPQGVYLVGEVGRGKSMLMDLFFAAADVPRKQRIHFHRFMQNAHKRVHAYKQAHPETDDPIPPLADSLASEAALLCFDEFQVHDIADAMILGRLFQALFDRGVVVVATSNTQPDDLFAGQPGRDAFLPFIAILKRHMEVFEMDAGRDFRRRRMRGVRTWLVPADAAAERALDDAFEQLTHGAVPKTETLEVMGRKVTVPLAAEDVARFDFDTLCGTALGPGDYLALASRYHTLILDGIPRLSPGNYDAARRFITLVDALYEHRVNLIASAAAMPDELYRAGENARMFERTASRLDEMQGKEWLDLPHVS